MNPGVKNAVKNLKAYSFESTRPKIKLDANESPYSLQNNIMETIKKKIGDTNFNRYPDPRALVLCHKLSRYIGNDIDEDMVIAGDGSDELISITINTYLSKGSSILIPVPTFSMYGIYSSINEAKIIYFKTREDFSIDADALIDEAVNKNAGLIILCNPNNPTGTLLSRKSIIKILEKSGCTVVIDEAYYEFSRLTVADLVNKYKNLIVLRTLSKAWGIAGLRLGYLISNKEIINELLKVKSPFNVNTLTQDIASLILDFPEEMEKNASAILNERNYLMEALRKFEYVNVYDSYANFFLFKVPDADYFAKRLKEKEIAVRNFNGSPGLDNIIRISPGTHDENILFIKEFDKIAGEIYGKNP